jgi:hypothetical protein
MLPELRSSRIPTDVSGLRRLSDCNAIRHADVVGLRRMSDGPGRAGATPRLHILEFFQE